MKNKLFIIALVLIASMSFGLAANAATTFIVPQGGTGAATFSAGQLLYGAGTGAIKSTATTTASCAGTASCTAFTILGSAPVTITGSSSGGSGLSTTSPWTVGQMAYVTSNAAVTSVATSTIAFSGPFSGLGFGALVGGANTTITWTGLSTSTAMASTRVLFGTGVATVGSASTFTFNTTGNLMTATNASTTAFTAGSYLVASTLLGVASSTPNFPFSVNTIGSEFYITSTGIVVGRDVANGYTGRISPTHSIALGTGTTTTWTASTTGSAYSPFVTMPYAGTLRDVRCTPDAAGLGVNIQVNGSNVTPSYFVASTTVGQMAITAGNTFAAGQKILANFGTTTTSTTLSISCTLDVTETP